MVRRGVSVGLGESPSRRRARSRKRASRGGEVVEVDLSVGVEVAGACAIDGLAVADEQGVEARSTWPFGTMSARQGDVTVMVWFGWTLVSTASVPRASGRGLPR